jgi:carnitine O-acetyltransferase
MRDDYLSTSAVPSPHVRYWGFGSTSEKCIGVGYAMMPGRFDLYLSTPRAVSDRMGVFAAALTDAVRELEELLTDG